METDVLLIGLGDLGGVLLEFLARLPGIGRVVVGSRDEEGGQARCNLARVGAMAQGYSSEIEFLVLDLNRPEEVAEIVTRLRPRVVIHTATMLTWWLPDLLPTEDAARIRQAGFGAWLPVHLTLSIQWMRALHMAEFGGISILAPYPDVVSPVLKGMGLTPTTGFGNIDEMVPKVRLLAAGELGLPPAALEVTLVAHHALEKWAFSDAAEEAPPYYIKVEHEGQDVTQAVQADRLLLRPYPLPTGPQWHFLSAASAVRLVEAFFKKDEVQLHAPGPTGLPGGYPVRVNREGLQIALPSDLALEDAVAINDRSHRFDGIEGVGEDGTVTFTPQTVRILRETLGYDCKRLPPEESEHYARELIRRFRTYAEDRGVILPIRER